MSPKPQTTPAPAIDAEVVDTTPSTALAPAVNTALAVPTSGSRDMRGKESIDAEDMALPRLALAQKTSPQVDPSKPEYIDGLKLFQMFNSLTGHNYGNGPVELIIIRHTKRAMEFDADNKIVDFNVPLGDPRLLFTEGPNNTRVKPRATLFHDYLCLDPQTEELLVLSLKTTQIKTAKDLNSLLMMYKGPVWGRRFEVRSTSKQHGPYTSGQYLIRPLGATTDDLRAVAEAWYDSTANFVERVDRTGEDAGSVSDPDDPPF